MEEGSVKNALQSLFEHSHFGRRITYHPDFLGNAGISNLSVAINCGRIVYKSVINQNSNCCLHTGSAVTSWVFGSGLNLKFSFTNSKPRRCDVEILNWIWNLNLLSSTQKNTFASSSFCSISSSMISFLSCPHFEYCYLRVEKKEIHLRISNVLLLAQIFVCIDMENCVASSLWIQNWFRISSQFWSFVPLPIFWLHYCGKKYSEFIANVVIFIPPNFCVSFCLYLWRLILSWIQKLFQISRQF